MRKKPPANNILLEVDFPPALQKSFYLILCSEKRIHAGCLSSWGDMGQPLPWEGIWVRAQARACSLTSSKVTNPFFEAYSKKEYLLVWWGTVPSLLSFERKEGVDTLPMSL